MHEDMIYYNSAMWKILTLISVLIVILIGLTQFQPQNSPSANSTGLPQIEIIAGNLEVPWALAFLPDGNILVTERAGKLKIMNKDGRNIKEIAKMNVKQTGESGLHGIAVDPKYSENSYVYLYYTYSIDGDNSFNKVSRFVLRDSELSGEKILVDKIPGAIFHDGGRIKFGPDGYLYITTGDALNPSLAQDKNALAGKILRVKEEQVEIYSYGHRNPQGITWDSDGRLWETEHGNSATDEVNLIAPGKNYGWPEIRGDQTKEGMEKPVLHSGSDTWAPAGTAYYRNSIYFAGLRGQALFQYVISSKELKTHFKEEFGRIRDIVVGPDNMLYITTSNRDGRGTPSPEDDRIIRINPEKL